MPRRASARLSALLLTAGLVVAGAACGSSSTDNAGSATTTTAAPTTTAVTKASFVEQANAICKKMNEDTKAVPDPKTDAETAEYLTKNADITQAAIDQMKALPQPTEDSATLQTMYTEVQSVVDLARQAATASAAGNVSEAQSLFTQASEASQKSNASANAYGLTECGKSSSSSTTTTKA